jgi:hypothetical protein
MARKAATKTIANYTPEQVEEIRNMLAKKFSGTVYICMPEQVGNTTVWELRTYLAATMEASPENNFKVRLEPCENGWITYMV